MKDKRKFTLIGLLVLILILATLFVIGISNVKRLYKKNKKERFLVEVQTIYKEATKKYEKENTLENKIDSISNKYNSLDLDTKDMDYCILFDSTGNVIEMAVSNGLYYITISNVKNMNSIKFDDIGKGEIKGIKCKKAEYKPIINCKFNGKLKPGVVYTNGPYKYKYKYEYEYKYNHKYEYPLEYDYYTKNKDIRWVPINEDGWGVTLTNKDSTEPLTNNICTYINDKPVVSMSYMYFESKAKEIDLSGFNTSNVTDMSGMFMKSEAKNIKGLNKLNTSNVTDMSDMFASSHVLELDLSGFDTSKVWNMSNMFDTSQAFLLDLSNFDTSNVVNMSAVFNNSYAKNIKGLNKLNTSNVTDMNNMFSGSHALELDLSNFDTGNVTNMSYMFYNSQAKEIDISCFDTSKVTNISSMFRFSQANIIYVRTQEDANRFKKLSINVQPLNFVVKE